MREFPFDLDEETKERLAMASLELNDARERLDNCEQEMTEIASDIIAAVCKEKGWRFRNLRSAAFCGFVDPKNVQPGQNWVLGDNVGEDIWYAIDARILSGLSFPSCIFNEDGRFQAPSTEDWASLQKHHQGDNNGS